jgi:Type VI secretion system/phage-baseplate injector OB domain
MVKIRDANGDIKYLGRSKAVVIDNRDPLNRGRIRVNHPFIGNSAWIDYLQQPSSFSIPSIGDTVYIEADTGEPEYAVASGNVTKGDDSNPSTPTAFQRPIPSNRGWQTPGGHLIEFDDGEATVSNAPIDSNFTSTNKGVRITTSEGNKILIDDSTNTITIINSQGKIFKLTDKQILGQGTEHMVLGDTWYNMMNTFLNSVISGIAPGSPGQNAASLLAIKQAATTLQSSLPNLKSPNSYTD